MKIFKLIFLFIIIVSNSMIGFGQCPNDLFQTPNISNTGQIIYFPFNGNTNNLGSGSYSALASGAYYTNGICGQAMQFDGVDDYIKLTPYVPLLSDYTIASWVYVDSLTSNLAIFSTRDQCSNTYRGYSQGELGINYYNNATGGGQNKIKYVINKHQNCTGWSFGERYYANNYTYSSGSWHFLALKVHNNISNSRTVEFYVDCELLSSTKYNNTDVSDAFNDTNHKSFIGAASDISPWIYSFNGIIDEFRIFNRLLTNDELKNLFAKCKPLNISINKYGNVCGGDSATIELINTESDVNYTLFDSTNQTQIGSSITGSCGNVFFNTGGIFSPTNFYIKATNISSSCTIILDTVIQLVPSYNTSISNDTLELCENDSVLINSVFYKAPNTIVDTLVDIHGCDSLLITYLAAIPLPQVYLGADTSLCNGDSILLSIQNSYNSTLWNTGSIQNSIWIDIPGNYWVKVSDSLCSNSDTIEISDLHSLYLLINDTVLCSGKSWQITLPIINQYLWWNNSTSNSVLISDSGNYWVEITEICKTYTDSFTITINDCSGCMIFIPNVFTPNGDGINDKFFPVIKCDLKQYTLLVFNRWGKLIFESTDQNEKWDGKYNDKEAPDGVYFYRMNFLQNNTSSEMDYKVGSITLYR